MPNDAIGRVDALKTFGEWCEGARVGRDCQRRASVACLLERSYFTEHTRLARHYLDKIVDSPDLKIRAIVVGTPQQPPSTIERAGASVITPRSSAP